MLLLIRLLVGFEFCGCCSILFGEFVLWVVGGLCVPIVLAVCELVCLSLCLSWFVGFIVSEFG